MTNQSSYEIKPLSMEDKKKLKRQYLFFIVFGVFLGAIFFFIFKLVLPNGEMGMVPVFVFTAIALIFAAVISYFFWSTYTDLKKGVKHCYIGFVTDKRINKHTTSSARHSSRGGSSGYGSSRKTTQTHYYVSVENKEHSVSYKHYSQTTLGDKVYLEVSPKKKEILTFTILEKNTETIDFTDTTTITNKQIFAPNEKSVPMRTKDIELVKKVFFKSIRKDLMFLIPITILLFVLWKGIFIFLIPLVIALVYYAIKVLIKFNQYVKFSRNGFLKTVTKAQVKDKLKITSNRNSTKFQLKTSNGSINVSEHIYNQIQHSQIIFLHKATFINVLYEVSFDDKNLVMFKN